MPQSRWCRTSRRAPPASALLGVRRAAAAEPRGARRRKIAQPARLHLVRRILWLIRPFRIRPAPWRHADQDGPRAPSAVPAAPRLMEVAARHVAQMARALSPESLTWKV